MRGLLAALLLPGALAGTCADSATLDYPAGLTGLERGSFAPPSEELDGTAGFSIAVWVYRERTNDLSNEHLIHFYESGLSSTKYISLKFELGMSYGVDDGAGAPTCCDAPGAHAALAAYLSARSP